MNREDALREADIILQKLLASGDEGIFAAATDASGKIDHVKLVSAALRARERIADKILQESQK
jgi:hypothetical protein